MKKALLVTLFVSVILLQIQAQETRPTQPLDAQQNCIVGRFQLHEFDYVATALDSGASGKQHGIFRIDTATGDVWLYITGIDKGGKLVSFWSKIDDSPKT